MRKLALDTGQRTYYVTSMPRMHPDDITYSLETANCDEARALLSRISASVKELADLPRTRGSALRYGKLEAARDAVRREAERIVIERGWQRRLPTDGYDGSYIGHSDD